MSAPASALLDEIRGTLEKVATTDLTTLTDEDLCSTLIAAENAGRLLDTVRVTTVAEVDHRSRFELGSAGLASKLGHRYGVHLVEHLTRASKSEARKRIRVGTAIRTRTALTGEQLAPTFPGVATAMTSGQIGVDSAAAIISKLGQAATRHADPDNLDAAEHDLVDSAATDSADLIDTMARAWREALDPDGAEPRDEALRLKRGITFGRERDGLTPFWGASDPINAALLATAFGEHTNPAGDPHFLDERDCVTPINNDVDDDADSDAANDRAEADAEHNAESDTTTADSDDSSNGNGHPEPAPAPAPVPLVDPRTPAQRRFDILIGLITAGMRSTGMRSTATVMAVIQLDDLENGTGHGHLDDVDEPVSAHTIQELACDAGIQKITLGPSGEVLHLGRLKRLFSNAQRTALAVRDGGCAWDHCTAPPSWCHAHHIIPFSEGGATDIDNAMLLCPAHHHMLHNSAFTVKMINGRPHIQAPEWIDPLLQWKPLGRPRYGRAA